MFALLFSLSNNSRDTWTQTKHFQTLFWTSDVRIVDCPGLVMPNFVPMEMQVRCSIIQASAMTNIHAGTFGNPPHLSYLRHSGMYTFLSSISSSGTDL